MRTSAKVIEDSISKNGHRITTLQLVYPRFIHSEFMTHRAFCISGDSRLDFELPGGSPGGRRVHHMTIREFADKWINGAAECQSSRHNGRFLNDLDPALEYSALDVSKRLGYARHLNLNHACRKGLVAGARKTDAGWVAQGSSWAKWRDGTGKRRFGLRTRLSKMRIRQVNEATGEVQTSTVIACVRSGDKPVFRLVAGDFSVVATKEHRILTRSGWKKLGDIQPGLDEVVTYKYGAGATEDRFKRIDGRWVSAWSRSVRDEVAERQGGMCHVTGVPLEQSFHIHHVEPRHLRPDLAFDLNNVVAVNPDAHRELHNVQGWQDGVPLGSTYTLVDSIDQEGEVDTYDLSIAGEYPNFFADGVVVHNSRNSMSSRAIPVAKMIEQVRNDPAMPTHWGKNQPGMQAREELGEDDIVAARSQWRRAAIDAADRAENLNDLGAHKQIVNRILEPFQWMHTIVTATDWMNFFGLRDHPDAMPEMAELARCIRDARDESGPKMLVDGEWHLPFVSTDQALMESDYPYSVLCKASAARCARVSYLNHDGTAPTIEKDIELANRLASSVPIHASPFEHQATPIGIEMRNRNFTGWMQHRVVIEASML